MKKQYKTLSYLMVWFILIGLLSRKLTYACIVVATESMEPTISKADLVFYKKYPHDGSLKEEEIILYNQNGKTIIHRILKKENNLYTTKGDNNPTQDAYIIKEEDIEGIYLFRVRYIGYPTIWINEIRKKVTE